MILYIIFFLIIAIIIYYFFAKKIINTNLDNLFFKYENLYNESDQLVDINNCIDYVRFKESLVNCVRKDSKKEIVFFDNKTVQTEFILYFLHGFNDDKNKGRQITIEISKIYNANIYFARLPDHGVYNKESAKHTFYDYLRDIYEDLLIVKLLGKKIILIGDSTGCSYSILISIFFKQFNIHDNIMFSPNIELLGNMSLVTKFLSYTCGEYIFSFVREVNINHVKVSTAFFIPLLNILNYLRKNKHNFKKNCIIFSSEFDPFISNTAIKNFYNHIDVTKKCLYFIENCHQHSVLKYNNNDLFIRYIKEYYHAQSISAVKYIN